MLTTDRIKFLTNSFGVDLIYSDNIPIASKPVIDSIVQMPYDEFRDGMGLRDIEHHWMLGENNFLAGGEVLNWVWGEDKNEDTDFFFLNSDAANRFVSIIQSWGFVKVKISSYADTYIHPEKTRFIQVVGSAFGGTPIGVISAFDFDVCKFAVSCDTFYTTKKAVQDLLSMSLDISCAQRKKLSFSRTTKYIRKGFYLSYSLTEYANYISKEATKHGKKLFSR